MLQLAMREQYKKNQERLDTTRWSVIQGYIMDVFLGNNVAFRKKTLF